MVDAVLVDGQPLVAEWLSERAFQFGDGLFETIAVVDGSPCLWDAHMRRLLLGCDRLNLPRPDIDVLRADALQLAGGQQRAVLKVYWTAGRSRRGYARPHPLTPQRVVSLTSWPYAAAPVDWTVRICDHRLSENPVLAGIKHLNRLDQVIARSEWDHRQFQEGLMLGQDGRVVCGTMSNLFLQSDGCLVTPEIAGAGIDGVVRQLVIATAKRLDIVIRIGLVTMADVERADAVYFTNSLIGAVRAVRVGDATFASTVAEHAVINEVRRRCQAPSEGRV